MPYYCNNLFLNAHNSGCWLGPLLILAIIPPFSSCTIWSCPKRKRARERPPQKRAKSAYDFYDSFNLFSGFIANIHIKVTCNQVLIALWLQWRHSLFWLPALSQNGPARPLFIAPAISSLCWQPQHQQRKSNKAHNQQIFAIGFCLENTLFTDLLLGGFRSWKLPEH